MATPKTASKNQAPKKDDDEGGPFIEVRTSNEGSRRRASFKFDKNWKRIDVSELTEEQVKLLQGDKTLTIREAQ